MSSHHYVKEGQEPALLVIDALADDHLLSLLEWSPLVLAASHAIPKMASWGVRVDVIFVAQLAYNEPVVFEASDHVGSAVVIETHTSLADAVLSYLRHKGAYALHVIMQSPAEKLHWWEQAHDFEITLFDHSMKWSRIRRGRFEKWIPQGSTLQVRGAERWCAWGKPASGNELIVHKSGIVSITSREPFWIGELHRQG